MNEKVDQSIPFFSKAKWRDIYSGFFHSVETNNDKADPSPSPYLSARREWEEIYGGFVTSAKTWKITALISLAIALISTIGSIFLANKREFIPYIVEVDRSGVIQKVQKAGAVDDQTIQRVIKAELTQFLEFWRGIVLDAKMQNENVLKVYNFLQRNTPAFTKITEHYKNNDPFLLARKESRFVEIINVLKLKDDSYQIEWKETSTNRESGETLSINKYKLVAYTSVSTPKDEVYVIRNPIGLILKDINWSKIM